jgi:hypothetical protein
VTAESGPDRLEALQQALAGEHAAVWAGGLGASRLSGDERAAALAELEVHRRARDTLADLVVRGGGQPVAAAPAYELPGRITGPASARDLLAFVNLALCPLYADLVGASDPADRKWPLRRCRESALAALAWGVAPMPFPGPVTPVPGSTATESDPPSPSAS